MNAAIHTAVFGIYPYIAIAVMVLGCIIRYDREPYTWRSQSSQLLRRRMLIMGSTLFHAGILIVFLGHFFGLLTPLAFLDWLGVGHSFKQVASMVVGGIAGLVSLLGGIMLLYRRLSDPRIRKTSSTGDIAILALLNLQLVIGLSTILASMEHLDLSDRKWSSSWLGRRGSTLWTWLPPTTLWTSTGVYKLHLFLGLTIFLVFPFTRLVHMLSAPVRFIWRPGYQVVRTNERTPASR